jgi:hypothetical protein
VLHLDDRTLAGRPGAAIAIRVHESATTRSAFDAAVGQGELGRVFSVPATVPIASLRPDRRGNVPVTFGLSGSDVRPTISISRPGVFPVEVGLANTGAASGTFVTWLVTVDTRTAKPVDQPLRVAWVWQLVADPLELPDGSPDSAVLAQMRRGGRLDRIAGLLAGASDVPVSIVVSPETAESWARLATSDRAYSVGFERMRAAVGRGAHQLLPAPYVPIDATALERAGLGAQLPNEIVKGADVLESVFGAGRLERTRTAFVDPADDATVDRLRQMLVDHVAVRDAELIPAAHPFTPAQPFRLVATSGARSLAVSTAPFIEHLLTSADPPAVRSARVVAALAEVAYEAPAIARGLVIAPPERWTPSLSTMTPLLAGLRDNPLVQATTLDDLLSTVAPERRQGVDVERRFAPSTPAVAPITAGEYLAAADELTAFREFVGPDDAGVRMGEHALLVSLSTSISSDRAHAALAKIDAAVRAFTSGITTDAKRITLTARHAKVPLTFQNRVKPARTIRVRVHFDSQKLRFPGGNDPIVALPPGNSTVQFAVEARASGTFPMTITLTSEDGRLPIGAPVRVSVRSAVFGSLAIALTVAALVFLAGWWGNHLRRARKARRRAAAAAT